MLLCKHFGLHEQSMYSNDDVLHVYYFRCVMLYDDVVFYIFVHEANAFVLLYIK